MIYMDDALRSAQVVHGVDVAVAIVWAIAVFFYSVALVRLCSGCAHRTRTSVRKAPPDPDRIPRPLHSLENKTQGELLELLQKDEIQ